jgi:hypothetical protein
MQTWLGNIAVNSETKPAFSHTANTLWHAYRRIVPHLE